MGLVEAIGTNLADFGSSRLAELMPFCFASFFVAFQFLLDDGSCRSFFATVVGRASLLAVGYSKLPVRSSPQACSVSGGESVLLRVYRHLLRSRPLRNRLLRTYDQDQQGIGNHFPRAHVLSLSLSVD